MDKGTNNENRDIYSLQTSANDIHEAIGADKHRMYVSQYLGSAERPGILNQLFEIIDNGIDEIVEYQTRLVGLVESKFGKGRTGDVPSGQLSIKILPTNEIEIIDSGRGLPCDRSPGTGEPVVYKIYESDSAGGKGAHGQGGYSSGTAGQHGAGAAVSQSCTEYFNIVTSTHGETADGTGMFMLGYSRGKRTSPLQKMQDELPVHTNPLLKELGIYQTGTSIRYKYDETILKSMEDGLSVEPYDKDQILNRLKAILLELENRNMLKIVLTYKDDEPLLIDPNEYTPELFLQSPESLLTVKGESHKPKDDKQYFRYSVYVGVNSTGMAFNCTSIVNRLALTISPSSKIVEEKFKETLRRVIENEYVNSNQFNEEERAIISQSRILGDAINSLLQKFKALIVMELNVAEFGGQNKTNLVSTHFVVELGRSLGVNFSSVESNPYFQRYVAAGMEIIKTRLKYKKQEKKEQARLEHAKMGVVRLKQESDRINNDPLESISRKIDLVSGENNSRFTLKSSSFTPEQSYLMLVEGASAANALGNIIDLPITVIGMLGKPANVMAGREYDLQQLALLSIEMGKPYQGLFLLTDADSDALHIRILLTAFVWEHARHYITQGKMYIINSPHARLSNQTPNDITINLKGVAITYPAGQGALTKSPTETELALLNGMTLNEKYGGLTDCLTDGEGDIELLDLVQDPNYRSLVEMPTNREIERLTEMLQESSAIKQDFT